MGSNIYAEESTCQPVSELYSQPIGKVTLHVAYEPLVILPGQNFKLFLNSDGDFSGQKIL
jgi:hypothetical protein